LIRPQLKTLGLRASGSAEDGVRELAERGVRCTRDRDYPDFA